MDKDPVEGNMKDIAGRTEHQAGEWTGDTESHAKGAAKQAEGKVQNAWGKAKDAIKKPAGEDVDNSEEAESEDEESPNQQRRAG
jgi:uncharacterized protein YjbJ (UPF0337 family)